MILIFLSFFFKLPIFSKRSLYFISVANYTKNWWVILLRICIPACIHWFPLIFKFGLFCATLSLGLQHRLVILYDVERPSCARRYIYKLCALWPNRHLNLAFTSLLVFSIKIRAAERLNFNPGELPAGSSYSTNNHGPRWYPISPIK